MAKKKASKTGMEQTDSKVRPVRLDLSPETHHLLRKVAADADMSMAAFARDALEAVLKAEAKRRGIKG
jgi:hypothetical protein